MRRRVLVTAVDVVCGITAVGVLLLLGQTSVDYELALQFTAVLFVLNLLDLWMPYGEPVPVDSALVVCALILGGPGTALVASSVARLAVFMARRATYRPEQVADLLARRLLSIALCALVQELTFVGSLASMWESLIIGLLFIASELLIAQIQAAPVLQERVFQLLAGNLELQGSLLAAQLSIAILAVITYGGMRIWGLVLMTLLVLLMRQSLALVLEIRQAYRGTIEALVAAIEIQDPKRRGHARRVERMARTIGLRLGVRGRELEHLGYAALLHDVDLIGVDPDTDIAAGDAETKHASEVVADVGFLVEVEPILRVCDGLPLDSGTGDSPTSRLATIVALSSDIDDAHRAGTTVPGSASRRVTAYVGDMEMEQVLAVARSAGLVTPQVDV